MQQLLLALLIGGLFGFVLDRIGATNPGYIIKMLNLTDLHLMKTILAGIGVASVLLFGGLLSGLVDVGHMSVKTAYLGVFIGGLLLGAGFAIAGYCPGTGLTAAATGRWDGLVFVLGGLLGAAAYMGSYAWVKSTGVLEEIAGGKTTLGTVEGSGYPALMEGVSGEAVGLAVGLVLILIAFALPRSLTGSRAIEPAE